MLPYGSRRKTRPPADPPGAPGPAGLTENGNDSENDRMSDLATPSRRLVAALPGPELTASIERAVKDLDPAGFILFDRNLKTASQTAALTAGLKALLGRPLLLAIDQEGGRVNRLKALHPAFLKLPAAREQAGWPLEKLEGAWERVGSCLSALGLNTDFAPVADLDDGAGANAIGPRSYSPEPRRAAACAGAVLAGLSQAGIAGCLKHFPGLGGTATDTHLALARSPLSEAALAEHALPYRLLAPKAPLVMSAHAHYPEVDGPAPLPATFSRRLLTDLLRTRIGYPGVVVSDDLEMGALAGFGSPGERARRAFEAGCDLVLFCDDLDAPRRARDAEAARPRRGGDPGDEASLTRIAGLLASFPPAPGSAEGFTNAAAALEEYLG